MKVLVITSCTSEKTVEHKHTLTLKDFRKGKDYVNVKIREKQLEKVLTPARDLYSGQQHVRLMRGVATAVKKDAGNPIKVDLKIISAGYGLIPGSRKIAPYEATFNDMGKADLRDWADQLNIPKAFRNSVTKPYNLILILLGDKYLEACQFDNDIIFGGQTCIFCGGASAKKLPEYKKTKIITVNNKDAKRFSCGLIGLKGELACRLLSGLANIRGFKGKLLKKNADVLSLLDDKIIESNASQKPSDTTSSVKPAIELKCNKSKANPKVDQVIQLPNSWKSKSHRKKLRYFIPEWDDLVDPDYDFENDIHSGGTGNWSNEVYAHQMYSEPNYDGILISKVVAEKSKTKKERINKMGVHRFLRVPREFPIMGDCGAFGYINDKVPPYSTEEILEYYTRLDFDYGVSVDHLIVTATEEQKKYRYELTINNAEEFLKEHRKLGLPWVPIGAVQGWDSSSYKKAASQYVKMGYKYIALGGLVRTPTKEVLRILEEVHPVVPNYVDIHLFGLARIKAMAEFARLGVRSVDSASFLRRAWMGTGQNYLVESGELYAAIRIPGAAKSYRAKRIVSEGRATLTQIKKLETACFKSLHDFDKGKGSIESTLDTIMEYDRLITPDRPDNRAVLQKTLEAAPWKHLQM